MYRRVRATCRPARTSTGRSSRSSTQRVSAAEPASRRSSAPASRSASACCSDSSSDTAPCAPRPTWQWASTRPGSTQPSTGGGRRGGPGEGQPTSDHPGLGDLLVGADEQRAAQVQDGLGHPGILHPGTPVAPRPYGAPMSILGTRVLRVEDPLLLTTGATYTDDLVDERLAGALHATFVRSPLAHARVTGVDTAEALASPGVVAVLTAADLGLDPLPGADGLLQRRHGRAGAGDRRRAVRRGGRRRRAGRAPVPGPGRRRPRRRRVRPAAAGGRHARRRAATRCCCSPRPARTRCARSGASPTPTCSPTARSSSPRRWPTSGSLRRRSRDAAPRPCGATTAGWSCGCRTRARRARRSRSARCSASAPSRSG